MGSNGKEKKPRDTISLISDLSVLCIQAYNRPGKATDKSFGIGIKNRWGKQVGTFFNGLKYIKCVTLLLFVPIKSSFGQSGKDSARNAVHEMDISDVARKWFHYKDTIKEDKVDSVSKKVFTAILPGFGYSILTGFTVVTTANFSFYVHKKKNSSISSIFVIPEYGVNGQFTLPVTGNIWTKGNKWNIISDYRYYKYSTFIYGLGPNTRENINSDIKFNYIKIHQFFYRQILPDFMLGGAYNLDYHGGIQPNTKYQQNIKDLANYGDGKSTVSSGFTGSILLDKRRNSNNPLPGGVYANIMYRYNRRAFGSSSDWGSLFYDVRKYFGLPGDRNKILAFWHFGTIITHGHVPYFDLPSTMWDVYDNSGRPYIQGRFRSKNMLYWEAEYRSDITRNGLLGLTFFANAQLFSNWPYTAMTKMIPGYGGSLRIKANKKSRVNFIVSYGLGINGSNGFFFNVGDVF